MSLKHAVLGFLSIAPMSGYDLRKHMEESVAHFWPADQAQIYRTLGHLAADGLVSVETIPQEGKPDRREPANGFHAYGRSRRTSSTISAMASVSVFCSRPSNSLRACLMTASR